MLLEKAIIKKFGAYRSWYERNPNRLTSHFVRSGNPEEETLASVVAGIAVGQVPALIMGSTLISRK
ncbi:MAG TPA: hypothetical protein VGR56_07650 [Nitrososphaerales archaeon]|nr:hypothetical protein [Nitrososphaerales archaeon]